MEISNPTFNLDDQSKNDDSIKQDGVTINADNGAIVNANSGNGGRGLTRKASMLIVMLFSVLGDLAIGITGYVGFKQTSKELEEVFNRSSVMNASIVETQSKLNNVVDDFKAETKKLEGRSNEGTIWILRRDILYWIDFFEVKKIITQKEYHRLQDEFAYYRKLGGNYDVADRWQTFKEKVVGTREIQMTK